MQNKTQGRIEIGSRIRRLRKSRGKNLTELATAANISSGYLSDVERGESALSGEKMASIARIMNVSVDYLLSGKNISSQSEASGITIPDALSEAATIMELSYEHTIRLLRGRGSLVAERSNNDGTEWTPDQWIAFYNNVKEYL
jgi:transcriptional regulator with XRE-family HTH domain